MKLVMVVCLVAACGKGDATKSSGGSAAAQPPQAPGKKGATGSVTTTGALAGTWNWTEDSALDCSWIPDLNTGGLSITMVDGASGAMALDALFSKDRTEVKLTSGKLKDPSPFKQNAGGVIIMGTGNTGGDAPVTVTAQFDAVTTKGDQTINVKGTIVARCN